MGASAIGRSRESYVNCNVRNYIGLLNWKCSENRIRRVFLLLLYFLNKHLSKQIKKRDTLVLGPVYQIVFLGLHAAVLLLLILLLFK